MSHPISVLELKVLRVQEDDMGPYAKIRVKLTDDEAVIRWGLDATTYRHLQGLVFTQNLESGTTAYRCLLSLEDIPDAYPKTAWLECHLGTQTTRLSFLCSDLYIANLQWLRSVQSVRELDSLLWDKWLEFHFPPTPVDTLTAATVESNIDSVNSYNRRRTFAFVVALIAFLLVISTAWIGWKALASPHPAYSGAISKDAPQLALRDSAHPLGPTPPKAGFTASKASSQPVQSTDPMASLHTQNEGTVDLSGYREIYKVPAGSVALTIDDGPSPYTMQILNTLQHYGVHATFFFVSNNAERFPSAVRAAVAQGNVVGNHSVNHRNLAQLTDAEQTDEILTAKAVLENLSGGPVLLFRPPYGSLNVETKHILATNGLVMALWNRDPKDWQAKTPEEVVKRVLSIPASGSVFDLHDNAVLAQALPAIIESLQKQHLKIVVMSAKS